MGGHLGRLAANPATAEQEAVSVPATVLRQFMEEGAAKVREPKQETAACNRVQVT